MMRWLIFLAVLMATPAWAGPVSADLEQMFARGAYDDAAAQVAANPAATPDDMAFAARALLATGMCGDGQPDGALLDTAEAYARAAIAADPAHVEGRLQLAITLSLKARPMSVRAAMDSGYGDAAKDLAEAVLRDDPANAYAHGILAVWNVEVIRRGGRMGGIVMGASIGEGRRHYIAARLTSPDDASLHWQWARALAALSPRKYRGEIDAALAAALAAETDTDLERVMQHRARWLADTLAQSETRTVKALAQDLL